MTLNTIIVVSLSYNTHLKIFLNGETINISSKNVSLRVENQILNHDLVL